MATACYEKEVMIEGASHGQDIHGHPHRHHHHHFHSHSHHHHRRGNVNLTSIISNSGGSSLSTTPTPTSIHSASSTAGVTMIDQMILSPSATNDIVISGGSPSKAEVNTGSNFKDFAQPLHVDCSVEYELPSQAKPPPGVGDPLLMIHPCYYRRAERERRSPFVNNLPRVISSSSIRKSNRREATLVNRNLVGTKSILAGGDAASTPTILASAAAAIAVSNHSTSGNGIRFGDALTASSPSSIAINTLLHCHRKAASQRVGDDTVLNQNLENDEKRLGQQHISGLLLSTLPTTADEKAVISGIYQHYFRAIRSHHHNNNHADYDHNSQPPQLQHSSHRHLYDDPHLLINSGATMTAASPARAFQVPMEPVSNSTRRRGTNQHHPYRRPLTTISRGHAVVPMIPSSPSESSSSSVYATAMNRHHAASLQALRVAAAAVAAAAAAAAGSSNTNGTTGSFYEAPAYRALLPRS